MFKSLIFLLAIGCSSVQVLNEDIDSKLKEIKTVETEIYPGKVKFLEIAIPGKDRTESMTCGKVKKNIDIVKGFTQIYLVESYFNKEKELNCFIGDKFQYHIINAKIKPFPYKKERLNVSKRKIDLSLAAQKRVEKEWLLTRDLYKNSAKKYLFTKPFVKPLNTYVTSRYGTRRIFNNKKEGQHLGNDSRAAVGVQIPVANSGKVIFTGDLFYTGNVVIVDHGKNIFTVYAHLSIILVKIGDIVEQRQIVGLAGATGRVSGPHLHWGVKIDEHWVDGFSLVEESQKQFRDQYAI